MKIVLIGATGYVGSRLLKEALSRGHHVTAIISNPGTLPADARLTTVAGDATNPQALATLVFGHDAVISAFNPKLDPDGTGTQAIIDGVRLGGVPRLLVVGGAGSLKLPSGERVVDQPDFPSEWKEGALRTARFLDQLRRETIVDWVFVSPAAELLPGVRSGQYRVGHDFLLLDDSGRSRISLEDYAVAMLDETEQPHHHRDRYTVAY
jgi:putative NADH-flavin reductase